MSHAPSTLSLFWALAAVAAIAVAGGLLTGRLRPSDILTNDEWIAALKLVGIFGLVLAMIYYQNGHFSDQTAFIYGRF